MENRESEREHPETYPASAHRHQSLCNYQYEQDMAVRWEHLGTGY